MSPFRLAAFALPPVVVIAVVWAWLAGPRGTAAPDVPAPPDAPAATADPGFPRVVAVPDGDTVALPRTPRRIVIANTALVDLVAALVDPARIAGLPSQADTWSVAARDPTALDGVPTFDVFVAETVLALDPDLVLCSVHSQPETVESLRRVAVPTVRFGFPETLDAVREQLRVCAELLGAADRLRALEASLERRIGALRDDPGRRAGVRAAFFEHDGNEGWSSGRRTPADEILTLAGLRNAVGEAGFAGPVRLTFEQVLGLDPDVLVIPEAHGEVDASTERALRDALATLRAVRAGRVVRLHPSLFTTTSHELVTAAEQIAAAVDHALAAAPTAERR